MEPRGNISDYSDPCGMPGASERCIRVASLFGRRRCLQLNEAFLHNYGRTSSLLGTNLDLCVRIFPVQGPC